MQKTTRDGHPAVLRAWHWLNALVVLGLLATVLLRKTWLSWRTNSAYLLETLEANGTTITPALAKALAQGLRDPMWAWHYTLGYVLIALLLVRVLVIVARPATNPATHLIGAVRALVHAEAGARVTQLHHAAVAAAYVALYAALAAMATTGAAMHYRDTLGLAAATVDALKSVHEPMMWVFPAFIALHIVGVAIAELRDEPGLVSRMIHGGGR